MERRYAAMERRWKVERGIAWLQSFRRIRVRDEVNAQNVLLSFNSLGS